MKVHFIISLLFATAFYSYAKEKRNNGSIKAAIIREIMKKMSNITLNSLSKAPDDKKELILNKIEQKLKKTAASLGNGPKYVKLIMEQFKNKAFKKAENTDEKTINEIQNKEIMKDGTTEDKISSKEGKDVMRSVMDAGEDAGGDAGGDAANDAGTNADSKEKSFEIDDLKTKKTFNNQTKEQIIKDISRKIEAMAKGYLRESKTFDQKQKLFEKIKRRILESSKRKHMLIHSQHNELKAYTNLITQGLELSIKKLLLTSDSRRMAHETQAPEQSDVVDNSTNVDEMTLIDQYKTFFQEIFNETSMDPRCNAIMEEICYRIGSLHKLTCGDGKIITLEQLCDGATDCWNGVDESNCTTQAIEKCHLAIDLMSDIDQPLNGDCFQPVIQNDMFVHQHKVVREMLEEQLKMLKKYKVFEIEKKLANQGDNDDADDIIFIKKLVFDVTKTVSSLSDIFDANLCSPLDKLNENKNLTRKSINPEDDDFIDDESKHDEPEWLPKSCICHRQFCKFTTCDTRCKRICWQKYSLNIWQCQSITGDNHIALDLICDGKLDCFDESDEASCRTDSSVPKYQVNTIYKDLLDILYLKSLSMEFEQGRNKVVAAAGLVRELQKLTTKPDVDNHAIKVLRDEYFRNLVNIYGDMLQSSNLEELDKIYEFLSIIHDKMIKVLKISHTGNEYVLAPAGCYCNNGTCTLVRCSRRCIATCQFEPLLIKYPCNDNKTSAVDIKAVCNGKNECPNEEDEKDCQKEVCRAHHLVVLRHNLQRAGMSLKGSVLGDVLDSWKSKVIASLIIAQGSARSNHKMLEDVIIKVLRDLVSTYASMEETKRTSPDFVMNEFLNMSAIVKQTLKYCNK